MRRRFGMLGRWGSAAAILAVVAALAAFQSVSAAPEPRQAIVSVQTAGKTFARICRTIILGNSRPDSAWVGASFAQDKCQSPSMPKPLDGFSTTREQIVAGMAAAESYAAAADRFQACIGDFVVAREKQGARPLSAAQRILENHRILVSEKNKKIAAAQIDAAIHAFNEYGSGCPG